MLVDRAARSRPIHFQDEHGLIGPLSVSGEIVVGRGRDKNVCEHLSSAWTLAIAHSVARGNEYPFAIAHRAHQLALGCELRRRALGLLTSSGEEGQRNSRQNEPAEKQTFAHGASIVRRALSYHPNYGVGRYSSRRPGHASVSSGAHLVAPVPAFSCCKRFAALRLVKAKPSFDEE